MKRKICMAVITVLLVTWTLAMAAAAQPAGQIKLYVDGELVPDVTGYLTNGRALVPLRAVSETMGARVLWVPGEKMVIISLGDREVSLAVGQGKGWVNGEIVTLDQPPVLVNNRVFIPIRLAGEALRANVEWDPEKKAVYLFSPDPENMPGTGPPLELPRTDPGPGTYDVIVVGGEPEGVAAALGAARAGARVLLIEQRDALGGLMTFGWLNSIDMNYGPKGELLTKGVFAEFFRGVSGDSFDVGQAEGVFARLVLNEPRISVLLNAGLDKPIFARDGRSVSGVQVRHEGKVKSYFAPRVVDATQDADLAAAAGVPFTIGAEDRGIKTTMAPTLVLHIGGVDWLSMVRALNRDKDPGTGANSVSAWGFWDEVSSYKPSTSRVRIRGLNIGRQLDGTVLINAVQIFGVDGLDPLSRQEGMELARKEAPRIVAFLREKVPAFASAYLVGTAPELYVRETRHIKGEYLLTIADVLENRDFPDRVGHGSYPVDIQSTSPSEWGFAMGNPSRYSIPYRSLVPLKVENLLVAGRSASYTSLAAGSTRVIPVGMVAGQAAGVAAAYSLQEEITPRELAYSASGITMLQEILKQQGAYLEPFSISNPLAAHWAYPYLRALWPLAVVAGGYQNNWQLDEAVSTESFVYLIANVYQLQAPGQFDKSRINSLIDGGLLTPDRALQILAGVRGKLDEDLTSERDLMAYFAKTGWLNPVIQSHWDPSAPVTRGMAYALVVETFKQLGVWKNP